MSMDIWVVGTLNLVFIRGFYNEKTRKTSFCKVNFVLPFLFVLTLVLDKAVLYGNIAFSIIVLSSKEWYSCFFKNRFSFPENLFQ